MKDSDDLVGKRFGKLTVLSPAPPVTIYNGKTRNAWNCVCDCGNKCVVRGDYLRRGQKTHCNKCKSLPKLEAHNSVCRNCKYSEWIANILDWHCGKWLHPINNKCNGFWCNSTDKLTGAQHRESKCIICGKPVYSREGDAPIYCEEHSYVSKADSEIISNAPMELMFGLIAGIFERARQDYIFNAEGNKKDAETFFRGRWAQDLSMSKFDADECLKRMDEEIHELERDREDIGE